MDVILQGLSELADPFNLMLIFAGVLIGVLVGALPGLSSPMAIALLIPFTISLDPVPAIAMMAALYCAGTFGGSITAILINAPGAPPAAATALDGYPMAKNGEPGRALGLATVSSVVGGLFSLVIFIFAAPLLAKVALQFRPQEYFALAIFALSMLASISGKSNLRNLLAGCVGVLLSTIGVHITTGMERFTFNIPEMTEGIRFVPVLIGLFAFSELLNQSQTLQTVFERVRATAMRLPSRSDFNRVKWTILRSSGLGTFIGILPAEGSTVAAIMGYNEAKRWSKNKEQFGTGCPEGIAGPEAANNAATGGAMVPTLALGIPGSGSTALILAALIMHGFRPGPYLINETPQFMYSIFGAMFIANLAFLVIGLVGAKFFSLVTFVPRNLLWPAVFVFSLVGAYSYSTSMFDVWVMLISGVVGFFMLRHGFGPAPLIMGLILGVLVEESFSQAMVIYDNDFITMMSSPICLIFVVLTCINLFWPVMKVVLRRMKQRRAEA